MPRQRILGFTAVAAFALLIGHGIAAAQARGVPQAADASAPAVRQVNLTPAEQLTQSESFLSQMDSSRNQVRQALEKARAARDVVKTLCLNDKLNQLDVAVRSARERKEALAAAAQRSDSELANHEFTILGVLHQRGNQLSAEANQCIGQEASFNGDNSVNATIDPGLAPDPSGFQPPGNAVIVEVPSCVSCTK